MSKLSRNTFTAIGKRSYVLSFACAVLGVTASPVAAQGGPGMGGNVGKLRTEAAVYRAHVRNVLTSLLADLGGLWDDSNPGLAAAIYMPSAVIVLGPDEVVQGREKIRAAFAGRLGKMHGVRFTMDEFDLSDELAFIRGTMSYELIHGGTTSTREAASFAMLLRVRRDEWLIQSHLIGGKPILIGDPQP